MAYIFPPYVVKVTPTSAIIVWVMPEGTSVGSVDLVKEGGGDQTITPELHTPNFQGVADDLVLQYAYANLLDPYTRYEYTVQAGDGSTTSEGSFITMREPNDNGPVNFVVCADYHGAWHSNSRGVIDNIASRVPDLVAIPGDLTGGSGNDWEGNSNWTGFFNNAYEHNKLAALLPVVGGHDVNRVANPSHWNWNWLFHEDNRGLINQNRVYYSYRHGNVEFFLHDHTGEEQNQLDWLNTAIPASDARWKILLTHTIDTTFGGYFEFGGWGDPNSGSYQMHLLCENQGVDVTCGGHTHVGEIIIPIGSPGNNPVHHTTTFNGKLGRYERPSPMISGGIGLGRQREFCYTYFEVDGDTMTITLYDYNDNIRAPVLTITKDVQGNHQQEILDKAIPLHTAITLGHIWSGGAPIISDDIEEGEPSGLSSGAREDIRCRVEKMPDPGETIDIEIDTGYPSLRYHQHIPAKDVSRFPIGSFLIIEEQTDPSGWQTEYQRIEITGDTAIFQATAPVGVIYEEGSGFTPRLEFQMNVEIEGGLDLPNPFPNPSNTEGV